MIDQGQMLEEMLPIRKLVSQFKGNSTKNEEKISCNVNFYFEYADKTESGVSSFRYAKATTDEGTRKSMIKRFDKSFSETLIKQYDIKEFDIMRNDDNTLYYADDDLMTNAHDIMQKIQSPDFSFEEDLTVLGKLESTKGAIIEIIIQEGEKKNKYYAFVKVDTFNGFKKSSFSLGLAKISNNGVSELTDKNTLFGVRDFIGFYYHNDHFVINSKSDFERMMFLSGEYKKRAQDTADFLTGFKNVLIGVSNLKSDLDKKSGFVLSRMLSRVSTESLQEKFNDDEATKKTIKSLDGIVKDTRFKKDFEGITVDVKNNQIIYSSENRFAFISLISDRAAETLFLGRKLMD